MMRAWDAGIEKRRMARKRKIHGVLANPETGKRYTLCGRPLLVRTSIFGERIEFVTCHKCRVRISWTLSPTPFDKEG